MSNYSPAPAVLVTGSRGLIGSRFFELFANSHNLISADLEDGYDILDLAKARKKVESDLGGRTLDTVVHLAAFTDVSGAHSQDGDEGGLCFRINVEGTNNVISIAEEFGAHLIHISTDFVFSGKIDQLLSESHPPEPIEWYGKTKLFAEDAVRNSSVAWTMMRIAFPYQRQEGVRPDLVANISNKLKAGDRLFLFGDQVITPTFTDDVCAAINRFLIHRPLSELFHVMGPESLTPYELGCRVAALIGCSDKNIEETSLVEYLLRDTRPRQQYMAMDTRKYRSFCDQLRYTAPMTLEKALS